MQQGGYSAVSGPMVKNPEIITGVKRLPEPTFGVCVHTQTLTKPKTKREIYTPMPLDMLLISRESVEFMLLEAT